MKTFSPQQFGRLINRSVKTLQRWDLKGILPAKRTPTNHRFYLEDDYLKIMGTPPAERKSFVYARVSFPSQKSDLKNQRDAIERFCLAKGLTPSDWIEEVGGGMNFKRKKFNDLMRRVELNEVSEIIIAHQDRLVRFGFEWFESFCKNHGTKIIVLNAQSLSPEAELTRDLLSIIHCFSSRLYGLRRYKKEITKACKSEAGK